MKRTLSEKFIFFIRPPNKKLKEIEKKGPKNMANKHTRPLSDMLFSKPSNANPGQNTKANPNPNSKADQNKYLLRKKKIERMSNSQIEAVITKNEQLEEENHLLKTELDVLNGIAKKYDETETVKVVQLEEENKMLKAELDDLKEKYDANLQKRVEVKDESVQVTIFTSTVSASTETIVEEAVAVVENVDIPKMSNKFLSELIPWLKAVHDKDEFHNLEKILILDEQLQADLIYTMAEKVMTPDEESFMKCFLARIFDPDCFINTIAFNARATKVQFKGTILFRCFAVSMIMKFRTPKSIDEIEEEMVEQFKTKIQSFMTDFKTLVKRNPNNWPH